MYDCNYLWKMANREKFTMLNQRYRLKNTKAVTQWFVWYYKKEKAFFQILASVTTLYWQRV